MIIYKDILQQLKDAGYNTNRIRKEKILPEGTLQRLRDGKPITTETIDIICNLTGKRIDEIIEHKKDPPAH